MINHKDIPIPNFKDHIELKVGKLYNYTGDNINHLNPYINEATGLYHIWKHTKDEIVGLAHYRRYFELNGKILTIEKAKEILENYDIILVEHLTIPGRTIAENNDILGYRVGKYMELISQKVPHYKEYMNTNEFNQRNMFVCKRPLLEEYCKWLFEFIIPLAEQFEREDNTTGQKQRTLGYLAEELLTFWCKEHNLKIYECKIREIDNS